MDHPTQPRRRTRRAIALRALIALAVLGAVGVPIIALRAGGGSGQDSTRAADLALVARTSFDITTTAAGELQARNQIEIRSQLDAESSILEVAPEGAIVKTGDLLLRLNGEDIQIKIDDVLPRVATAQAEAVAAVKGLEIQVSENESKVRQARLKHDLALLALDQWDKGERVQKEKDIELALDRTAKDLERLEEKYALSSSLFAEGFLSKNELQLDEIQLREARAARAKALLEAVTYHEYQRPKDERSKRSDAEEAAAELDRVQKQAEMQRDIKTAEANSKKEQLRIHQRRLTRLQEQLASCTVKAPQDGLVVYATSAGRNWFDDSPLTVGRTVRPQEILIVLPDTSEMLGVVKVHESLAGRVRPGQRALVTIDALGGGALEGTVDSIGVMAETQDRWRDPNKREYTIKVALGRVQSEVPLKPSMRCESTITLARVEDAIAVPIQAVFSEDALKFVYAPSGGRYARVPVQIGRRSDTMAEISTGLAPGAQVLLREPAPSEVIAQPWDEAQLRQVGFALEDGKPTPIASARPADAKRPPRQEVRTPDVSLAATPDAPKPEPKPQEPSAPEASVPEPTLGG